MLDVVGGDEVDRNLAAVRAQGTIVQVGLMGGGSVNVNLGLLLCQARALDRHDAAGPADRAEDRDLPALRRRGAAAVRAGALRPVIDRRYRLEDVAEAHRHMEADANVGKILLDVG